ncbi:MAG: beta-ketoacyl synthase chain length factor [Marinilabiliaceae bacterium]|nr:beta-ketoacyl synthase chain length factor [Marinilabiliaceae bacterium]
MIFINSIGSITPNKTIENGHFQCVEPLYKELINPIQLRRMSRILKMGLGASTICIQNLPESKIDAIIVGTGLACILDLEKFLFTVLEGNEQSLSPIPFINSTHNTVAAQIAFMHKITGYSNTFCGADSFDSALADAILLLNEDANQVLIGGIDEYSEYHFFMNSEEHDLKNAQFGEGAIFFILEKELKDNSFAQLIGVHSFLTKNKKCNNNLFEIIKTEITLFLKKYELELTDIEIFVSGKNGNCFSDDIYDILQRDFFPHSDTLQFKHLCGEYMTSTAFAMEHTARHLSNCTEKYALIYNHFNLVNHSIILMKTSK